MSFRNVRKLQELHYLQKYLLLAYIGTIMLNQEGWKMKTRNHQNPTWIHLKICRQLLIWSKEKAQNSQDLKVAQNLIKILFWSTPRSIKNQENLKAEITEEIPAIALKAICQEKEGLI